MIILSKIFGNSSFNSAINLIRQKNSNLKLFLSFLVTIVLASSMLTNVAWAYKDGDFPGVGSYAKWQEANVYFNKAVPLNNLAEEEALYKKAIEIYPYDAGFWINYANSTNNKQEKLRRYLEAARLNPDDCSGYQGAGVEYQRLGQYEKAIECIKKAIAITPTNVHFYASLGDCYQKLKKYDEAVDCYKSGFRSTNDIDLYLDVGVAYLNSGNYQKAKECFESCQKLQPNNQNVINSFKMLESFRENNK